MKTTVPKASEIQRKWFLLDAEGRPAGRLAVEICSLLRGRGKADFAPHIDMGDFVVVVNTAKVKLTGRKESTKTYAKYTGFQSGLKETTAGAMRAKNPNYIIWHAVKDMLPKNHLSRKLLTRLKLYPGPEHPHTAQKPVAQA
jgi:large subunit ribosomal protein L13